MSADLYNIDVTRLSGEKETLGSYSGKVLLIVNVASRCGYTPQYKGLEQLWQDYKEKGLVVLGFPCNQFGAQEPGSAEEIQKFCSLSYEVSFPMFQKIDVNGTSTHPLFALLKQEAPGLLGTEMIKWNFTKFLVDKNGKVFSRYAPADTPESMRKDIESLLN